MVEGLLFWWTEKSLINSQKKVTGKKSHKNKTPIEIPYNLYTHDVENHFHVLSKQCLGTVIIRYQIQHLKLEITETKIYENQPRHYENLPMQYTEIFFTCKN